MDLATVFFGLFLGLFAPTSIKVFRQSWVIWSRTRRLTNVYVFMIWAETVVNLIFAITTYLFIQGVIPSCFNWVVCQTVLLWTLQVQLLTQIIANRVALIMVDKHKSRLMKWLLFGLVGVVNISVFVIWIPAHMEISPFWVNFNSIWERLEKCFFLVVDCGLNFFFLYLVRFNLIAKGLTKYSRLFQFNAFIVCVSIAMDGLLLGLLSLKNSYIYVQFAPVAYIVKLNIELTMAVLISKVARSA
ncbi:hypothetical protein NA57DRAFT_12986, partial [Rhizodiscina lignyota]